MKALLTALALASLVASPALAQHRMHHVRHPNGGQNLYLSTGPGADPNISVERQGGPPGVVQHGYLLTDPDPLIRLQLNRGYMAGSTD